MGRDIRGAAPSSAARLAARAGLLALALSLAACGGGDDSSGESGSSTDAGHARAVETAQDVAAADLPAVRGRTLQEIADGVRQVQGGLATSEFTPGENRLAFGVIGNDNRFIYGKSAVYLAPTPATAPEGPSRRPPIRWWSTLPSAARGRHESDSIAAIYEAARTPATAGRLRGAAGDQDSDRPGRGTARIQVQPPSVDPRGRGSVLRSIETETVTSAGGDIESIETRVPPDDMHEVNFKDVLGKQPVALLFATPAAVSDPRLRPVTDIAAQLQKEYGDEGLHPPGGLRGQQVEKGLREPLRAFGLRDRAMAVHLQPAMAGWPPGSRARSATRPSSAQSRRRSTDQSVQRSEHPRPPANAPEHFATARLAAGLALAVVPPDRHTRRTSPTTVGIVVASGGS